MKHTPYGYMIVDGKAVVDPEKAENLKRIIDAYLSGMSFTAAAMTVGITMSHCGVKHLIQNPRYLGDSFYPAILTEDTAQAIEDERIRREQKLGRERSKKEFTAMSASVSFTAEKAEQKYDDPVAQAEYAYSLIESEVAS